MRLEADWTPLEKTIPKDLLRSEVDAWARRIRVEPKEIHVRPMKRKWGVAPRLAVFR